MPPTNWWNHRFKQGSGSTAVYTFVVNHFATMLNEDARSPNDSIGCATIDLVEPLLAPIGLNTGANWYIQRVGSGATKYYKIHHDGTVSNKCPAAPPGYSSIQYIVDNQCLSYFNTNGTCKPQRMYAPRRSKSKRKGSRRLGKSDRGVKSKIMANGKVKKRSSSSEA